MIQPIRTQHFNHWPISGRCFHQRQQKCFLCIRRRTSNYSKTIWKWFRAGTEEKEEVCLWRWDFLKLTIFNLNKLLRNLGSWSRHHRSTDHRGSQTKWIKDQAKSRPGQTEKHEHHQRRHQHDRHGGHRGVGHHNRESRDISRKTKKTLLTDNWM